MVITFYGEGCFKVQSGELVILTDPAISQSGLTPPRFKSDLILKTISPFPINSQESAAEGQAIFGAGEYNVKNVNVYGFPVVKESTGKFLKTIYLVEMEQIKLCFLGHLSEAPEPTILERLEEIDILFFPAGGQPFIDQKSAVKIIKQLEPKIVIPAFYKIPSLKRPAADLKIFLEEFNSAKENSLEPQEKLTIKKKDFLEMKKTEIVILKA